MPFAEAYVFESDILLYCGAFWTSEASLNAESYFRLIDMNVHEID